MTKEEAEGPRKDSGVRARASLLGWVSASSTTPKSKTSGSLVPFCLELGMGSPNRSSSGIEMIECRSRETGHTAGGRGQSQLCVHLLLRAASSPAPCLPTGLLDFPEGRAWAPSSPSLVSVDTGGLANGSKVEVPPRASQGRKRRRGGLAKKAGTGLSPFQASSPPNRDRICCPLVLERGVPRSPLAPHPHPLALHLPGVVEVSTKVPQGSAPVLSLWWGEFCAQGSVEVGLAGSTGVRPQGSEEESVGGRSHGWLRDRMLPEGTGDQGSAEGPQEEPVGSVLGLRPEMGTTQT